MIDIVNEIVNELNNIEDETLLLYIYKYICALEKHSKDR